MALQGDLDTFAFPDVLRLLAGTAKSGRLELDGDRGQGAAWLRDGGVVGGEVASAPHAEEPVDVIFELLRFHEGSFRFDGDADVDSRREPVGVDLLLEDAEAMLAEWREVEAVVPSLDVWLSLSPEITADEVVVSRDDWRMLATLGGGTSARELGDRLGMTELAVSRVVRDLVAAGTVVVGDELPAPVDEGAQAAGRLGYGADDGLDDPDDIDGVSARARLDAMAAALPADHGSESTPTVLLPEPLPGVGTSFGSGYELPDDVHTEPPAVQADVSEPDDGEVEQRQAAAESAPPHAARSTEHAVPSGTTVPAAAAATSAGEPIMVSRQLANLSPVAAEAIAAAASDAGMNSDDPGETPEPDEEGEHINRGSLLRFLSSVKN